ncbi:hypothetical protein FACS189454_01480 [Planctomycetales bacterium]|nr:hypothetical protein FACS189454_01480 [Planctomycetales bacterium]
MNTKTISPKGVLNAVISPPGSKSITNRALVLAALCDDETELRGVLDSEDTELMYDALGELGLKTQHQSGDCVTRIVGCGGAFPNRKAELYVGNSGTTARFLSAILAFADGEYRIFGKPRMHQRPIQDLTEALKSLGANIEYEENAGFPPIQIRPRKTNCANSGEPRTTTVAGNVSSQFLTALLLAAPIAARNADVEIKMSGGLVSKPYIEMTLKMMRTFGVEPERTGNFETFRFPKGIQYQTPVTYFVEPDASAASYFWGAAAVCGGSVKISGLSKQSLQGDIHFVDCLAKMNCDTIWEKDSITVSRPSDRPLRGITIDMNSMSDTAQTLAVVALFAEGSTRITNIEHVRYKETDRIADLATELRRFGASVEEQHDGLTITPPSEFALRDTITVQTYDDHRMAMSFALAGLKLPNIQIANPDCCKKTFPDFFDVWEKL